jgi:hypothetical protein
MTLIEALNILADSHTRDDHAVGFTVSAMADQFQASRAEYVEAWGVVRKHLGRPVRPEKNEIPW